MVLYGGSVSVGYLLAVAVGRNLGGIAIGIGLYGDGCGFTDGVVYGQYDSVFHGVVDDFIVSLLRHGLAASATRRKQGKYHYEGSR